MAKIPFSLPTLQNWSCHNCGGCCRQHAIYITDAERTRIESQRWGDDPDAGLQAESLFVQESGLLTKPQTRLAQRADGACVFLNEQGLCRIHAKFGEPAKPLACRIYPYAFHPAGDTMTVSLRFSCPSVVENKGKSLAQNRGEISELIGLTTPAHFRDYPPPGLREGVPLDWAAVKSINHHLEALLSDESLPFDVVLLRVLFFLGLLDEANYRKISTSQVPALAELASVQARQQVTSVAGIPREMTPLSMSQFRLLVAQYARVETFAQISWWHRLKLLRAAFRFSRGRGLTPPLNPKLGEVPFQELERDDFPGLTDRHAALLRRLLIVKVQGLHYCGAACHGMHVIEGMYALLLMLPAVVYLARWHSLTRGATSLGDEDVITGITLADHHHAYSPALATSAARQRVHRLARQADLHKLLLRYVRG